METTVEKFGVNFYIKSNDWSNDKDAEKAVDMAASKIFEMDCKEVFALKKDIETEDFEVAGNISTSVIKDVTSDYAFKPQSGCDIFIGIF